MEKKNIEYFYGITYRMEYLEIILKGLLAGFLSAYLILFGLRPAVAYPEFILELFENLWIFLILLIVNYYVFIWDYTIGAILLLCIVALVFDYVVFTSKGFKKVINIESQSADFFMNNEPVFNEVPKKDNTFYDVIINKIENINQNIYPGSPSPV